MKKTKITYLKILNSTVLFLMLLYIVYRDVITPKINFIPELTVERLNVVGSDKNHYMVLSNPERQALATTNGVVNDPDSERDLPGIIFFNRVGDEVGGIYYDGTDTENIAGITFDQQKNDQIMAIMKDEYKDGDSWKRWYGMFFRERADSVRVEKLYADFAEKTQSFDEKRKREEYLKFKKYIDENINKYRMFLGREENGDIGLFLYDSKSRMRIKLHVDDSDNARLEVLDTLGNSMDLLNSNTFNSIGITKK
ncbi:hypothetical protein [Maribacter sp. 2210JD10-5]|uniref:hypothetical protein n=1 Tax=Maribacter sp. 2210JD10-5 TaxID=3386272 RepID=UPI0039BC9AD5